jgi:6-phosphogluconate dehydrogenase
LHLSAELQREAGYDSDPHGHYISAYAGWQTARLTPKSDGLARTKLSAKAHALAQTALKLADEQSNQYYIIVTEHLLNSIEADFSELAADEVTDAAAGKGTELPPDSSLTN